MKYLKKIIAAVLVIVFVGACAVFHGPIDSYELIDHDTVGLGAEIRQDPLQIRRLFSIPEEFFTHRASDSPPVGWLGISMSKPAEEVLGPKSGKLFLGLEVRRVFPNSPASQAGLKEGDIIFRVDGKRIQEADWPKRIADFRERVLKKGPGEDSTFTVLRKGQAQKIHATLAAKPKAKVRFNPNYQEKRREPFSDSIVRYALAKENLIEEYVRTAGAIREKTSEAVSPAVRHGGYNPFRLAVVNEALHHPFELSLLADEITENLHRYFGEGRKDIPKLIEAAQAALGQSPVMSDRRIVGIPTPSLMEFIEQFVEVVLRAKAMREEAISFLQAEELDTLYEISGTLLAEDPDKAEEEKTDGQKRREEDDLLRFFNAVLKVDLPMIIQSSREVAQLLNVYMLPGLMEDTRLPDRLKAGWTIHKEKGLAVIETPAGKVLVGGVEKNIYREDVLLIIDLGGDDLYLNRAGGGSREIPFSVVIDLSGNDQYKSSAEFAQGAGILGAGFLIDLAGNDTYTSLNYSQGAGMMGVGVLVDESGDDKYKSIAASQGAGAWGIGILAEGGGRDDYSAARYAQGFGFVQGFGAIVEVEGDDKYFAGGVFPDDRDPDKSFQSLSQGFGFGMRPWETIAGASGGIGVIAEAAGNDVYIGDYFAQGASYWYALGILADKAGDDRYTAGRYSQGAGIHLSAGVLVDSEGNDSYSVSYGVSQGLGHDLAVGFLLDNGGDDVYSCGVMCQGVGNDNGIGILNDNGGNDRYRIEGQGQGSGNLSALRGLGSFGFHFDTGGGDDEYSHAGEDNQLIYKTDWGIFLDTR